MALCLKILASFAAFFNLASALPSSESPRLFQRQSITAEASCAHGICTLPQGRCVYSCNPDDFSYGDQNQYKCIPDINTRRLAPDASTELSYTTAQDDPSAFECKHGACVFPTHSCATSCSRTKVTYNVCPSSGSPRQSRPSMPLLSLLAVLTSLFLCFPVANAAPSDPNLLSRALTRRGAPTYDRMTCKGWKRGACTVIEGDCIYVQTSTKTWTHGPAQDHPCFGDPQPGSRIAVVNNSSGKGDALGVIGRSDNTWIPDMQCPALKPLEEILPQGICIEGVSKMSVNFNTCGSPDPCSYSAGSFVARAPKYKAVLAVMAVLLLIHIPTGGATSVRGRLLTNAPAERSTKGGAPMYKGMTCHGWKRGQRTVDPGQCVYRLTSTWTFIHGPIGGGTCSSQQSSRTTIHNQTEDVERHSPRLTGRQNTNDVQQVECAARPTQGEDSMPCGTCIVLLDASSVQYDACNDWDPCCAYVAGAGATTARLSMFKLFLAVFASHLFMGIPSVSAMSDLAPLPSVAVWAQTKTRCDGGDEAGNCVPDQTEYCTTSCSPSSFGLTATKPSYPGSSNRVAQSHSALTFGATGQMAGKYDAKGNSARPTVIPAGPCPMWVTSYNEHVVWHSDCPTKQDEAEKLYAQRPTDMIDEEGTTIVAPTFTSPTRISAIQTSIATTPMSCHTGLGNIP